MAEKIKLAEREHPLYTENSDLWELYLKAVKGGKDFIENNLFSHRLEDVVDFTMRKDRGYYLNFCDTVPTIYNNYIFKEEINRTSDDDLKMFRANTNGRGSDVSEFVKRCGYFASIFGVIHALVDTPSAMGIEISEAEAKDKNIYPYATIIFPTQLVDWSIDDMGKYNWVVIKYSASNDSDPNKEREDLELYKLITREEWRIEDQDGNPVKFEDGRPSNGKNALGIVPIATMYHSSADDDDKIGESMLKDIVYINRIIMNWCSLIDEQFARNCFSQLVIPDDGTLAEAAESGKHDPLIKLGTSSAFTFNWESRHAPQFISPETTAVTTIWNIVLDHVKEIYRVAGLISGIGDVQVGRSGRAAQVGFLSTNAALADKATAYQNFENQLSKLAYLQLGKTVEEYKEVVYPTTFDLTSLQEEITNQFKVMEKNFSVTLNKEIQKSIAKKVVPLANYETIHIIETEIESGTGLVESNNFQSSPDDIDRTGEDGNPNLDNLNDPMQSTEKTKAEISQHRTQK